MRIIIEKDYQDIGKTANKFMRELLINNPNATLGLATGSSPVGLYKEMIADNKAGITTFKNIKTVNLDEYVGLPEGHDQTYRYFMNDNLFNHIDIDKNNTRVPNGMAENLENACKEYTDYVAKNIPDVQILGIGSNGHIAFNDPGVADFNDKAMIKVVELDEICRNQQVNDGCFKTLSDVPKNALTLTVPTLTKASSLFCSVPAKTKAWAVKETLTTDKIDEHCPATIMRLHNDACLYCDSDSASML